MPFKSKSQQKWAFANKKPWAKRWAHETGEGGKGNKPGSKASKSAYQRLTSKVRKKKS